MRTLLFVLTLISISLSSCSSVSLDPNRFASQAAEANRDESRIEKALRTLCDKGLVEFCEKEARVLLENGKSDLAKIASARGCEKGKHSSCAVEGDILLAEEKILEATQVLTPSCEALNALEGVSCPGAGEAAYLNNDAKKAQQLWNRGCQLGNKASCYFSGKALRLSNRISESLPPLKKSCEAGVLGACSELGISLALEGKMEPAIENFSLDCDRRSHRACRWLPLLQEKMKSTELEKTLEVDCRKNNSLEACYDSTILQFLRKGGRTLALYRWKENCKANHKMSCWEVFVEENGLRPLTQMNVELEKFCGEGILVACYFRGLNFAEAGKRDRAFPLWNEACLKGEPWSCYLASEVDTVTPTEKKNLSDRACSLGLKRACPSEDPSLAEMKVTKGEPLSVNDFGKACSNGDADACTFVALKKIKESPLGEEDGDAKDYYRRACLASSTLGCEGFIRSLKK